MQTKSTNFKKIHLGEFILQRFKECNLEIDEAAIFFKRSQEDIKQMFEQSSLDTEEVMLWSELLNYDFFRLYSQHLVLYSPQYVQKSDKKKIKGNPVFKKNIYTHELITYLVELVINNKKSLTEIQRDYNIPVTTVSRWIVKYKNTKT